MKQCVILPYISLILLQFRSNFLSLQFFLNLIKIKFDVLIQKCQLSLQCFEIMRKKFRKEKLHFRLRGKKLGSIFVDVECKRDVTISCDLFVILLPKRSWCRVTCTFVYTIARWLKFRLLIGMVCTVRGWASHDFGSFPNRRHHLTPTKFSFAMRATYLHYTITEWVVRVRLPWN